MSKLSFIGTLIVLVLSLVLPVQILDWPVVAPVEPQSTSASLRFYGNGQNDIDRVKIRIEPPTSADVGNDFTIEFWMKAQPGANGSSACTEGGVNWIYGNIMVDRDIYGEGDYGDFGISLAGGRIAFGVARGSNEQTICSTSVVDDGAWHHIALTRNGSSGQMRIFVDGVLERQANGPTGDISYRDGRSTSYPNSDPYLVLGAEKHDAGSSYPSYNGWMDEFRISTIERYSSNFTRPAGPFTADGNTAVLYHFNEATSGPCNGTVEDASSNNTDGECRFGGSSVQGPVYSAEVPFSVLTFNKVSPANGAVGQPTSITLSWESFAGATGYEYCYTSQPNGCLQWQSAGNSTSVVLQVAPNYTYYWQVRALTGSGAIEANNGEWWSFSTENVPRCAWPPYTSPAVPSFSDVPFSHFYFSWIERLRNSGLSGGYGDGTYRPDNSVTRAQMAVFLLRGRYCSSYVPPGVTTPPFSDVPVEYWAASWIKQLVGEGITKGYPDGTYRPENAVTRAEMAVFLLRSRHGGAYVPPPVGSSTGFNDVPPTHWAAAWIKQLAAEGITSGCGGGNYCPENAITRGEMAVFLVRSFVNPYDIPTQACDPSSLPTINAPPFNGSIPFGETAIAWFGQVGPNQNYADIRVGYNETFLYVYISSFDRYLWYDETPTTDTLTEWDAVTLLLDTSGSPTALSSSSWQFVAQLYGEPSSERRTAYQGSSVGWQAVNVSFEAIPGWRGNALNDDQTDTDRGWAMGFTIPFSSLGIAGQPVQGTTWRMAIVLHDRDGLTGPVMPSQAWPGNWVALTQPGCWGFLRFGLPSYTSSLSPSGQTIIYRPTQTSPLVPDADVGGTIENQCPGDEYHIWNEWGNRNAGAASGFNIQNQSDIADWPCFSKYYVTFPLDTIPAGKVIVSATLTLYQFGNAGGAGQAQPSWIQVLIASQDWQENVITWNNAPMAQENIGGAWVNPITDFPGWPGVPRSWDVSYAVAQAYQKGQPLRLILYSADGNYHSGKYFVTSDTGDWNEAGRPRLTVQWADPPSSSEWTQHAHDAQHTSYTSQTVTYPWRLRWIWNGVDSSGDVQKVTTSGSLPRNVQPVTGGGRVYVAAGVDGVFALDEATGQQVWQRSGLGDVRSTVAYDPQTQVVFVVSSNGRLYKLDASNGSILAQFDTGQTSDLPLPPAIITDRILFSMGNSVYAVNKQTLQPIWQYNAGNLVAVPPAYSASRDLVIVATEPDLNVHAIRNQNGQALWVNRPVHSSRNFSDPTEYRFGWPVIADSAGYVLVKVRLDSNSVWVTWPQTNSAMRQFLTDEPWHQALFVLDLDDGSVPYIANVGNGGYGDSGYLPMGPQPVVKTLDNGKQIVYVIIRAQNSSYDSRWDSWFGEMVLDSTTVSGLQGGDVRFIAFDWPPGDSQADFLLTDEQPNVSMAGDLLFGAHWEAGFAMQILDRSDSRGSISNPISTQRLSTVATSQDTSECAFSPSHYCPSGLYNTRPYDFGFYIYYNQGNVYDQYWSEYATWVVSNDNLYFRSVDGAIVALTSGNPASGPIPSSLAFVQSFSHLRDVSFRSSLFEQANQLSQMVIPFSQARQWAGRNVTVRGEIQYVFNNRKQVLLGFSNPHQGTFKILIPKAYWSNFSPMPDQMYRVGMIVEVSGLIDWYQGDPAIYVTLPEQIKVFSDAAFCLDGSWNERLQNEITLNRFGFEQVLSPDCRIRPEKNRAE